MVVDKEIKKLKLDLFSGDWDKMKASTHRLFEIGGEENVNYLIGLLDQNNSRIRDAVALTFRENGFNQALEPIWMAINKKENRGYTGTLVYALEKLDCSTKLKELFNLLFENNSYEVKNHVLRILDQQTFEFTEYDLKEIRLKWETIRDSWNESNKVDNTSLANQIDRELIQDFVDGFVSYLEKK